MPSSPIVVEPIAGAFIASVGAGVRVGGIAVAVDNEASFVGVKVADAASIEVVGFEAQAVNKKNAIKIKCKILENIFMFALHQSTSKIIPKNKKARRDFCNLGGL
jgi:hypothetical protein